MSRVCGKPTVFIRDLCSRGIENGINVFDAGPIAAAHFDERPWSEFRRLLLLYAFADRSVTMELADADQHLLLGAPPQKHDGWGVWRSIRELLSKTKPTSDDDPPDEEVVTWPRAISGTYGCDAGEFMEFKGREGDTICSIHWPKCSAETLTMIANYGSSFELNFCQMTSISDRIVERLTRLGAAQWEAALVTLDGVPETTEEVFHCAGDGDGYLLRWLNPGIEEPRIIEHVKLLCRCFYWNFYEQKLDFETRR